MLHTLKAHQETKYPKFVSNVFPGTQTTKPRPAIRAPRGEPPLCLLVNIHESTHFKQAYLDKFKSIKEKY